MHQMFIVREATTGNLRHKPQQDQSGILDITSMQIMSFKVKQVTRTKVTPSFCLRPKQATLNLVATLNRWESAPPALYKGPTTGFSDWISMLEANA